MKSQNDRTETNSFGAFLSKGAAIKWVTRVTRVTLAASFTLLSLTGCSGFGNGSDSVSVASSSSELTLSVSATSIEAGATVRLRASGGSAPYEFTIESGNGIIDDQGVYTAPSSIGAQAISVSLGVVDVTGDTAYIEIRVNPSSVAVISATLAPTTPVAGDVVTLTSSGGTAPYTYSKISGSGTLSGAQYTSLATSAETAVIRVSDASGATRDISIVTSAPIQVIMAINMTGLGVHVVGGNGCPSSYVARNSVADGGGGTISGDQVFCTKTVAKAQAPQIVTDVKIDMPGNHVVGGVACQSGYVKIGSIADCSGGACSGEQNICVRFEAPSAATSWIKDFYVTPQGSRSVTACLAGYDFIGLAADCQGGTCYGFQNFCLKR